MDFFGFDRGTCNDSTRQYVSGTVNAGAMFDAYSGVGASICVVATQMKEAGINRAVGHLKRGAGLLVDSGAYEFRNEPEKMPWAEIVSVYRRLANVDNADLSIVLPDVVGDQHATLQVLSEWGPKIVAAVGNAGILLPLQPGAMNQTDYAIHARALLGRPISGVAVPIVSGVFSGKDFAELADLPVDFNRRVHFLGVSWGTAKLKNWMAALAGFWPDAETSCDSTIWRPAVGEGKEVTDTRQTGLLNEMYFDAEFLMDLRGLEPETYRQMLATAGSPFGLSAETDEDIRIIEDSPAFDLLLSKYLAAIMRTSNSSQGARWTQQSHREWALEQPWLRASQNRTCWDHG